MKISEIKELLNANIVCGEDFLNNDVHSACGSDMMSDVLAYVKDQAVLLTGLVNSQVIRTAEMMDMVCVVFVRSKQPTEEMIELIGGHKVLEAVKLLTKEEGYSMHHYISRIKANPIAFAVKAADRLHNLRTIGSMPERKIDKILSESMYIFVPLAHKLGLYSMKSEMENIWLRYREPDYYNNITKKVEQLVEERGDSINQFIAPITQALHAEGYKDVIL